MIFRLLEDNIRESALHFAVEEAILRGVDEGTSPPTLRMRRSEKAVWIGIHQKASEEVNLDLCAREGIPVMRRHNPGGAVYQDSGSLCFSCTFRKDELLLALGLDDPENLYQLFGRAIARTGEHFGASITWAPVNDATIDGKKVFGSAQIMQYSALSHTGSLLVDVDFDTMARVLQPPSVKFADKNAKTVRDRVVNFSEAVGKKLDPKEVSPVLSGCIAEELGIELIADGLNSDEQQTADVLYREKYHRREWTYREAPRTGKVLAAKCKSGVVSLNVCIVGGAIESLGISGDFLLVDTGLLNMVMNSLSGMAPEAAAAAIRLSALPADIRMTIAGLLEGL